MSTGRHARPAPAAPLVAVLALAAGCGGKGAPGPVPPGGEAPGPAAADGEGTGAPPAPGHFRFVDGTAASGLGAFHQVAGTLDKSLILDSIGGGVAFFDYDGDGDLDAWLTNGTGRGPDAPPDARDAVFANDGAGHFSDVTDAVGVDEHAYTCGVRTVDLDGDGWTDVYLTNWGPNALYHNDGGQRFVDATEQSGLGDPSWGTGAAFLDFDRDGDLDLYLVNYVDMDPEHVLADLPRAEYRGVKVSYGPRGLDGAADRFFRNEGSGRFTDATDAVGIAGATGYGFQAVAFDRDDDGWVDVYVANDSVPNYLWENQGGKRFEDQAFRAGLAVSMNGSQQASMGIAVGDWDGDLDPDLYVTNFAEDYYTLYRNQGMGVFVDVTRRLKLANATYSLLGWGCELQDLDGDGDLDLFAADGHVYPQVDRFDLGTTYRQRNVLFENPGDGRFRLVENGGPGLDVLESSRGVAAGDVDADGDLDLLVGNLDASPTLLLNETAPAGHWFAVRLEQPGQNRDALGARVVLRAGERSQLALAGTSGSFLSSDSPWLWFGLGTAERVDGLEVTWPDGEETRSGPYDADARVVVQRPAR